MTDKEKLKDIAKAIGWGFFAMSIIESWHFFSWFFNGGTWQDTLYALVSAPLINFVEVLCFAIWYHFRKEIVFIAWPAFVFGLIFASVSVMGSLGWVGVKYDVNLKSSGNYQRVEKQQQSYQAQADSWLAEAERRTKEQGGRGAMYAKEQAAALQAKADGFTQELANFKGGGGAGNALFDMLAGFWDITSESAANIGAVLYSFFKEAAMVFLLLFAVHQSKENVPAGTGNSQRKRSRGNGEESRKNVHVNENGNDSGNGNAVPKPVKKNNFLNVPDLDPRSEVYQETVRLLKSKWVTGEMSLQQIADSEKVNRGKTYVHKVKEREGITRD